MAVHHLTLPAGEAAIRALTAGDEVFLTGEIITSIGLPTYDRIWDFHTRSEPLPVDLRGAALLHVSSYVEERGEKPEVLYINPTTSTRFNHLMPRFIRTFGLRLTGGKGGLDLESARAMQEVGCAYLSFLGGSASFFSSAVKELVAMEWTDLLVQYRLLRLRVEELGPLIVGIDAKGGNLYDSLQRQATERRPAIMAQLAEERARAAEG
ncbi:fumarate hydratase C-terminal domain-containing protein [Muricoccus radiodurans]|uniref:fumarate hydratase C-terminal domain-containing protein n=1 Tax=Muricoccus radiodurans TaxID=2231721 RepID=UPI003CF499ED